MKQEEQIQQIKADEITQKQINHERKQQSFNILKNLQQPKKDKYISSAEVKQHKQKNSKIQSSPIQVGAKAKKVDSVRNRIEGKMEFEKLINRIDNSNYYQSQGNINKQQLLLIKNRVDLTKLAMKNGDEKIEQSLQAVNKIYHKPKFEKKASLPKLESQKFSRLDLIYSTKQQRSSSLLNQQVNSSQIEKSYQQSYISSLKPLFSSDTRQIRIKKLQGSEKSIQFSSSRILIPQQDSDQSLFKIPKSDNYFWKDQQYQIKLKKQKHLLQEFRYKKKLNKELHDKLASMADFQFLDSLQFQQLNS